MLDGWQGAGWVARCWMDGKMLDGWQGAGCEFMERGGRAVKGRSGKWHSICILQHAVGELVSALSLGALVLNSLL